MVGAICVTLPSAQAHQQARVFAVSTPIYAMPSRLSTVLTSLPKGTIVQISNQNQRGMDGTYWHKIRLETGMMGYIETNAVNTPENLRELKAAAFQTNELEETNLELDTWVYEARLMGMVGAELTLPLFETALELELLYALPIQLHDRIKQMFTVGPAFLIFDNREPAVLASFAFTPFQGIELKKFTWIQETSITPVFRLRIGKAFGTPLVLIGGSVGITFPFKVQKSHYYSGYIELGTLEKYALGFYHVWLALGASYRF